MSHPPSSPTRKHDICHRSIRRFCAWLFEALLNLHFFLCSIDDRFTSQLLRAKKGWEGYLPSILHHLSSARFAGITSLRFTDKLRVCLYSAWHTVLVAYSIFLCHAVRDVELLARRKCLEMQGTRCRRRQLGLQPLNVCSFFCTYI